MLNLQLVVWFWKLPDGILGHQFNKRLESFSPCFHRPFYWRMLKKTKVFSGFKNPYKKIRETKKTRKNKDRKPDKNLSLIRLEFMPRNAVQEFYLCTHVGSAWEQRRGGSVLEHEDRELHVSALWADPELSPSWWVQMKSTLCFGSGSAIIWIPWIRMIAFVPLTELSATWALLNLLKRRSRP